MNLILLLLASVACAAGRTSMPILQLIQSGQVDTAAIHDDAVDTGAIKTDAVTTPKIITGAVNTFKLASDSVTTAKVLTGAIDTRTLASDSVTSAKLLSDSAGLAKVTGGLMNQGSVANGGASLSTALTVNGSSTTLDNATNATDTLTVKVNANDKGIIFKNANTDSMLWWLRRNGSADNAYMKFGNGGAEAIAFNGSGQRITGAAASGGLQIDSALTLVGSSLTINGDVSALVVKGVADTTKFIIQPGGNVGIGTASPQSSVQVGTSLDATLSYTQIDTLNADTAGAPASGDCDAATEVGRMIASTRYSATADYNLWVCVQTGAATFAWYKTALVAP